MNRKYIKKALAIILGIAMLPALAAVPEEKVHAEESVEIPDRMKQIAENSELELYFDEERTDIACSIADDADSCVANGCGRSLQWISSMQEGTINLARRKLMKEQ